MENITYTKKEYMGNVVYSFTLPTEIPDWLKRDSKIFNLNHLVVECDTDNPFNPNQDQLDKNKEMLNDLMDAGAVAANKPWTWGC